MDIIAGRTAAREIAMHLIFEMNFKDISPQVLLDFKFGKDFFEDGSFKSELYGGKISQKQKAYMINICMGIYENKQEIQDFINKNSIDWDISRISKAAIAILSIAIYEIKYIDDISTAVAINEAVFLAREYGENTVLINGILGAIASE